MTKYAYRRQDLFHNQYMYVEHPWHLHLQSICPNSVALLKSIWNHVKTCFISNLVHYWNYHIRNFFPKQKCSTPSKHDHYKHEVIILLLITCFRKYFPSFKKNKSHYNNFKIYIEFQNICHIGVLVFSTSSFYVCLDSDYNV